MSEELKNGRKKSVDPAAQEMIDLATEKNISTMFSRVDEMKVCPMGDGSCCKLCAMGPCRLVGKDREEKVGICGATMATIAARNLARHIAAGAAAHSDHGRDIAIVLLATARGEAEGYEIKDELKLYEVAGRMSIDIEGKTKEQVAEEVALEALDNFGRQFGPLTYVSRAPKKRQELWEKLGITPRGIDREVVELMHRTNPGTDQDAEHILDQSLRTGLSSGWGGSMLATDMQDILFGTPKPLKGKINLGVLKDNKVNIIIHGHDPSFAEMMALVSNDPELLAAAKEKGARGIQLAGICCTSNEILMRRGIPPAGNFLHQELAIITGAVDAMVLDVQCTMQSLVEVAKNFHTKVITTSPKAKIEGADHMEFDHHHPIEGAKAIIRAAIENYPNRGETNIPDETSDLVAGFSHEYIRYMLGGKFRASLKPLNENIINGKIQGVAAIVGCNNPRSMHDEGIVNVARELIAQDVLVVVTGCAAGGTAKAGLMTSDTLAHAGEGLREVCEATGMPPVLHLGSCVDNSRILTILSDVVATGGLGEDIDEVPAVGICPEWYCEKPFEIAAYAVASGCYVLFSGGKSPVEASTVVTNMISEGWEKKVGGKLEIVDTWQEIVKRTLDHIQKKRQALGIDQKQERVLFDMEARRELSV
jgi:anaerobic carbon-monoxide dehydrogenase catalytic subunit